MVDEVADKEKLTRARDASLECVEAIHVAGPLLLDLLELFMESWKQGKSPELDEPSEYAVIYRKLQSTFDDVHSKWKAAFTPSVGDAILLAMPSGGPPLRAMGHNFASAHCAAGGALDVLGKQISILLDREEMLKFDDKFRRQVVAETIPDVPVSELRQGIDREWREAIALTGVGGDKEDALQNSTTIPAQYRTKVMTKKNAAKLLGRPNPDSGVKWLNDCIKDGTISCEEINRQTFVFDKREFPKETQPSLK